MEHHLQDIDNLSIPSDIGDDEGDHFDASQPVASKWYLFFHFPIPFYNVVTGFREFHPNGNFCHLEAQKLCQLNSAPLKYSVYAVIQFFFL